MRRCRAIWARVKGYSDLAVIGFRNRESVGGGELKEHSDYDCNIKVGVRVGVIVWVGIEVGQEGAGLGLRSRVRPRVVVSASQKMCGLVA